MSGAPGKTPGKTPGKMSKRQSCAVLDNGIDDDPPLKRAREDDKRVYPSPCLSKLGGLNGLNRKHEKPDELFRKDLISAMKLADTEQLEPDMYVTISDPWKQDWERGVQVPVAQTLNKTVVREKPENMKYQGDYAFKLPQKKMLYACKDENYQTSIHELHETHKLAEQVCRYDLDNVDVAWLKRLNEFRTLTGELDVEEWVMEKIMEELETLCYNNMQTKIKTVEGLGIEYDENVVCDVCRSPDSEDGNEMVFCDACDICVHQACYGVGSIPSGNWLCRSCAIGVTPKCMLCPKLGGAMKSTKNGSKWAHVACALWIPEINIGDPEKMEPITRVKHIPASRWSLVCSICRVKEGACIQCAVKTCKTAFHVTCAFSNNLDMKTILDDNEDDVQLRAFCTKHSKKTSEPPRTSTGDTPKKESEMTEEEKTELRSHRLQKLAEEFYTCVTSEEVAQSLKELVKEDVDMVDFVKNYWVLKRKANFNKPLLTPKTEEADLLSKQREDSLIARMKMFIHLRQDLERVRNLCYMVSRREKTRRQLFQTKDIIFRKQLEVIETCTEEEGSQMHKAIVEAHKLHRDDSVYDQYDDILRAASIMEMRAQQADLQAERNLHLGITLDSEDSEPSTSGMQQECEEISNARRPSLDSSDDEGDMVEQSVEQMKEQKNRKLASVRMSKLLRDRKENDRRKRQAEAEEAAKKAIIEKAAETPDTDKEKEKDKESKVETKTETKPEEPKPGPGRPRKLKFPDTPKVQDDKANDKADTKLIESDSIKKPPVKTPGKIGRPRKRPLSSDDRTSEKCVASPKGLSLDTDKNEPSVLDKTPDKRTLDTPDKIPEKKEVKSSTGRPRGRPRKIVPEDKDKSNTTEGPPTKRRKLSVSENTDDKDDIKKELETEDKKSNETKSETTKKVEKEEDDKDSKKSHKEENKGKKEQVEEKSDAKKKERVEEKSDAKKKEETRGRKPKPKIEDSPDKTKSKTDDKSCDADSKSKKKDTDTITSTSTSEKSKDKKDFKKDTDVKVKKDVDTLNTEKKADSTKKKDMDTLNTEKKVDSTKKDFEAHKTKDLEKKMEENQKKEEHKRKPRDSKTKDEHTRESSSSRNISRTKSKEERRRSTRDASDDIKSKEDKRRSTRDASDDMKSKEDKRHRESSVDTIVGDHSPEAKCRRSLRSTTPVCPTSQSDQVSVRSATPVSDTTGKSDHKDTDELDNASNKKSRSRRTSKVSPPLPSDSNHADTKSESGKTDSTDLAKKIISLGEPTVELSRLRDSDFKVKDDSTKEPIHNLRVKDQNRPSPKSFKGQSDTKLEGSVQIKNFSFLKQSLVVPAHIRRKVENGFKLSKLERLRDNTQKKISSFFKASNGLDKKENEPVTTGNDRLLSPATSSVSPRSYSPRGSNSQILHPEPGSTPDLRSVRRQIQPDLADSNDASMSVDPYECGSNRRLRSRDVTPEHETSRTKPPHRKSEDFNRRVTERNLVQKLNGDDPGLDSELESLDGGLSDTDSDIVRRRSSRRLSKPLMDMTDDESRHSTTSTSSRYSMRSTKHSESTSTKS